MRYLGGVTDWMDIVWSKFQELVMDRIALGTETYLGHKVSSMTD